MVSLSRKTCSAQTTGSTSVEASVWKSYLAIRPSSSNNGGTSGCNVSDKVGTSFSGVNLRGRKRAKPLTSRSAVQDTSTWITLASPLRKRRSDGQEGATVLESVRYYWEHLSVNERQQILFLDEPELVKQLYKLNLSLLCVGLMQRHFETSTRSVLSAAIADKKVAAMSASTEAQTATLAGSSSVTDRKGTPPSSCAVPNLSPEKTYELLEAMEFMDIGTGILTVKTELAEDTDRLFTLVEEVLEGFLTSVHVLKESKFIRLFVTESETINSWPNYQRLIAMLVEQLILRSYVSHLEKEAARQMEQLLLEVSLEDKSLSRRISTFCDKKRKSKKQKKRKAAHHEAPATDRVDLTPSSVDDEGGGNQMGNDPIATSTVEGAMMEPVFEPTPEFTSISADSDCHYFVNTEPISEVTLGKDEVIHAEVENSTNKLSRLNPNALVFQPQEFESCADEFNVRSSDAGKRSFGQYVISVPWDDVNLDGGSIVDSQTVDSGSSSGDEDGNDRRAFQRSRRKQRRREEDTELESQLQQVYASTSSLFGWDFLRQRELQDVNVHWSELMLWRTAPKEVVRYFSSDKRDTASRFQAPQLLAPACPVPSRYYFNMQPSLPFGPPLSGPPARMEIPLYGTPFGYPLPDVVSSPDFSSMQYSHPSDQDDQA